MFNVNIYVMLKGQVFLESRRILVFSSWLNNEEETIKDNVKFCSEPFRIEIQDQRYATWMNRAESKENKIPRLEWDF